MGKINYKGKSYGGSVGSNPNLLINGDFQVNQRGESIYTGNNLYTVDRWRMNGNVVVTINDDGSVSTNANNSLRGIYQFIENPHLLSGKTVTISTKCCSNDSKPLITLRKMGVGESNSIELGFCYGEKSDKPNIISFTVTLPKISKTDYLFVGLRTDTANSTAIWHWAKLELGSIATPFIPRLYAEELVLCQRYYRILNMQSAILYAYPDKSYMARVNFESMRIVPTIKYFKGTSYNSSDLDIYTHDYSIIGTYQGEEKADCLTLRVNLANAPKSGCYGILITMRLDAEIY